MKRMANFQTHPFTLFSDYSLLYPWYSLPISSKSEFLENDLIGFVFFFKASPKHSLQITFKEGAFL